MLVRCASLSGSIRGLGTMHNYLKTIGSDGIRMLALSSLIIVVTGGISWLWQSHRVLSTARRTPPHSAGPLLVVLGQKLQSDTPTPDFERRLDRAVRLFADTPGAHILILGGYTGRAQLSEAGAGREYLVRQGIPPEAIHVEDHSRHTLENLRQAREMLPALGNPVAVLITCRYHLARTSELARGLGLNHRLCAAEEHFTYGPIQLLAILREGYFLHWYRVGRRWSEWRGNRFNLARIN